MKFHYHHLLLYRIMDSWKLLSKWKRKDTRKKLISCSQDETIKIWEKNNKNYQSITILTHFKKILSILLLENKNIIISEGFDGIKFWNLNNFDLIKNFKYTFCEC